MALGVAGGYFLGRTKKMKLALMLGGMAAGRRLGGPGELLSQGSKLLSSSPELTRLVDEVRGRLVEAGKGAAVAVATRQVEALTDRVGKRVESLAGAVPRRGSADDTADTADDTADEEPEDERYTEDAEQEESAPEPDEEPAEEEAPPPRRRSRTQAKATTSARAGKKPSASATAKRGASTAGRAAGRKPARPRSQGSDGRG